MKYRFYTKTDEAWAGMREAIREAKKSIFLESFILTEDEKTRPLLKAIKEKAKSGIKVKIIADAVGSFGLKNSVRRDLEASKIEVLSFSRWFYRNHRKILIIDETTAFVGGVNVSGEYNTWLDLHLRTSGRLVRYILHSFAKVYERSGGKDKEVLSYKIDPNLPVRPSRTKQWFIEHWPLKGTSALRDYYKKTCSAAKESITIVTPYFIPHRWLVKLFRECSKKKVSLEVILPFKTDVWFATAANHAFARKLKKEIKFFFVPEMIHAKVLLVDNREGLIGSNNIDAQSFDFNLEASVRFERKDMVGDLRRIVEKWKKISKTIEEAEKKLPLSYRIVGSVIGLFQPIL